MPTFVNVNLAAQEFEICWIHLKVTVQRILHKNYFYLYEPIIIRGNEFERKIAF